MLTECVFIDNKTYFTIAHRNLQTVPNVNEHFSLAGSVWLVNSRIWDFEYEESPSVLILARKVGH